MRMVMPDTEEVSVELHVPRLHVPVPQPPPVMLTEKPIEIWKAAVTAAPPPVMAPVVQLVTVWKVKVVVVGVDRISN